MKRTPCCRAISPSSCGSMMTKRDLSYSKCRSIKGRVPLPIEPKPIMTMGPEIFAWICEAGLISGVSPKKAWVGESGGAPLRGHFDLDLHLGLVEAHDNEKRGCRADLAENLAADREMRIRVVGVGDVIGRANDIGHREASLVQGRFDGLEAVP